MHHWLLGIEAPDSKSIIWFGQSVIESWNWRNRRRACFSAFRSSAIRSALHR